MSRFIPDAGVWQIRVEPAPCAWCDRAGHFGYVLHRGDTPDIAYCSVRHWAYAQDKQATVTGEARVPHNLQPAPFQARQWAALVARWGSTGDPGITRTERDGADILLYRTEEGELRGILRRSPNGSVTVFVDPANRHQGVGQALVRAAVRLWGIDLSVQTYTADGIALTDHIDPRLVNPHG